MSKRGVTPGLNGVSPPVRARDVLFYLRRGSAHRSILQIIPTMRRPGKRVHSKGSANSVDVSMK